MFEADPSSRLEHRVLVWVRGAREGELTVRLLSEARLPSELCASAEELRAKLKEGAGALLLAEETLAEAHRVLADELARQPPWSDLPILVFSAASGADRARARAAVTLGNVIFLDRPVQTLTMIAAVQAALRSRDRQYESRRAIESRDAFLAMLGHELRNPLGAIALALDALEKKTPTGPRPGEHAVMERQVKHLSRLVDDLLDVARVTRGKVVMDRQRVDLAEITRAAFEAYELRARERELRYSLELSDRPLWVMGDRQRLEQVIGNLVANAIKYTSLGGNVTVAAAADGEKARVTVVDDGVGLEPKMLEHIFAPFAQVDTSLDRSQGGLGLGLALVQSLVTLHDGEVQASSPGLGQGCRFEVRLPRAAAPESLAETPNKATAPAAPLRILVVDDNEDIRELLTQSLTDAGHTVNSAGDGPSGLEALLSFGPDVAFLDVGLPGFDGYELARRARASGSHSRLIALTGYGQKEDKQRSAEAGFDEHLVKPVLNDDICRTLQRAG